MPQRVRYAFWPWWDKRPQGGQDYLYVTSVCASWSRCSFESTIEPNALSFSGFALSTSLRAMLTLSNLQRLSRCKK